MNESGLRSSQGFGANPGLAGLRAWLPNQVIFPIDHGGADTGYSQSISSWHHSAGLDDTSGLFEITE
jgi:hypothetical protein